MTNLTKLDILYCPKINLSRINLTEFIIRGDISDFSHMTNLTRLNMAYSNFRVNLNKLTNLKYLNFVNNINILDQDISDINPIILDISNTNILNISHMTNLQNLAAGNSKLTKITNQNLKKLYISGATNIKIISLPKLKYLNAYYNLYLELIDCPNLEQLYFSGNNLKNLKKLTLLDNWSIYNTSIQNLELEYIGLSQNQTITDLNYMTSLKILNISGKSGLTSTSIQKLNLLELYLDNNIITDINKFTNIKKLKIN